MQFMPYLCRIRLCEYLFVVFVHGFHVEFCCDALHPASSARGSVLKTGCVAAFVFLPSCNAGSHYKCTQIFIISSRNCQLDTSECCCMTAGQLACLCAGSGLSSSAAFTCSASLAILGIFGIDVQKLVSAS